VWAMVAVAVAGAIGLGAALLLPSNAGGRSVADHELQPDQ
jgi:hypothetical protein